MYDEEIEKAVLYYIIYENADYIIQEDDFTDDRNKKIAKAINQLKTKKEDISMISVKNQIQANQKQVLEYIAALGDNVYGINIDNTYHKLIQLTQKRKIFDLAKKVIQNIENEDIEIYSQTIIKNINDISNRNDKETNLSEQVIETINEIEKNWHNRNDYSLYTGIIDLDKKTCGLHNQELTILGARPRNWKNNISFTNSKKTCKTKTCVIYKLGNVRNTVVAKNHF